MIRNISYGFAVDSLFLQTDKVSSAAATILIDFPLLRTFCWVIQISSPKLLHVWYWPCMIDLVRLNANGKKSAWQPSLFKPTGACWKSSGTSRKRFELACWFRGCSGGTLLAYESIRPSRTGIRPARWHTMRKWQLLFRNCKSNRKLHYFRFLCFLRQKDNSFVWKIVIKCLQASLYLSCVETHRHLLTFFYDHYSYRGYYSRRWEHDFYARKKYLQYVETKNEEVRRNLDEHNRQIAGEEQKR